MGMCLEPVKPAIKAKTLILALPHEFHFERTVHSHGWYALKPHLWDDEHKTLAYCIQLSDGSVWQMTLSAHGEQLTARLDGGSLSLTAKRRAEIKSRLRWIFRLDEDFAAFFSLCAAQPKLAHVVTSGGGRILRCATLWEDFVRVLATTNITWIQTKRLVALIVNNWGAQHPTNPDWRAFPPPKVIAQTSEADLKAIGLGYRAAYLLANAQLIAGGGFDLEALQHSPLSDKEVRAHLLRLRGIGDYAANTLMLLLGRYSGVPVDTEARAAVSRTFFDGQKVTDKQVKETLAVYQPYAALALYCLPNSEDG